MLIDGYTKELEEQLMKRLIRRIVWTYKFNDGTILQLLDNGLSVIEVAKLKELHGKVEFSKGYI